MNTHASFLLSTHNSPHAGSRIRISSCACVVKRDKHQAVLSGPQKFERPRAQVIFIRRDTDTFSQFVPGELLPSVLTTRA